MRLLKCGYISIFTNIRTLQQISGTAIGTNFAPPYACIYMDQVENRSSATQELF